MSGSKSFETFDEELCVKIQWKICLFGLHPKGEPQPHYTCPHCGTITHSRQIYKEHQKWVHGADKAEEQKPELSILATESSNAGTR